MKRNLLILSLFLTCIGQAFSQNYFVISKVGTTSEYNFGTNGTKILSAPTNDQLSPSQTLPFTFNFYGTPVTSFKASDNGYLTFDNNATVSNPSNKSLPDTTAPHNAIFALWQDLQLQNQVINGNTYGSYINTWTYGTAPNRVFVVQWMLATPKGTPNTTNYFAYFAIRLYEQNYFDVVENYGYGSGFAFTVGCQNSTGTLGTQVQGSPALNLAWSNGGYDNTISPVYEFHYATATNDIRLENSTIIPTNNRIFRRSVPTLVQGDALTFGGNIYNFGTNKISTYTINYSIDGSTPVTKIQTKTLDSFGGNESVPLPTWTVTGQGGFHTIKVWISSVNGLPLSDTSSYSASYYVFVINGGQNSLIKQPLLECFTGAWCGYCPNGHISLKKAEDANQYAIGMDYHWDDLMAIPTSTNLSNVAIFNPGFPGIMVDRQKYDMFSTVAISNYGVNDNPYLDQNVASDENNSTSIPVSLDIVSKSWDPATRAISFTVSGKFADYAGGDIRLNAFIVEDSVRGPDVESIEGGALGWDQHNYYSSQDGGGAAGTTSDLYGEPFKIVGYVHNGVVRQALTGDWGINLNGLSGPNEIITPNTTFTKTFTATLPARVNVDYSKTIKTPDATDYHSTFPGWGYNKQNSIRLVAFISNYNLNDPTYDEVLNATQQPLLGWSAGVAKYNSNVDKISMYPNPAANSAKVEYTLAKTTDLTIEVYNVMGQKMQTVLSGSQTAGLHTMSIDAAQLSSGLYFVSFTSNGTRTTKQLMIQK